VHKDILNSLSENRFEFFFGFENMLALFRNEGRPSKNSNAYEIINLLKIECGNEKDALTDCMVYSDSGLLKVKINDVIGIKINGMQSFYRYLGRRFQAYEDVDKNFFKIEDFIQREKTGFLRKIHKLGYVLDVLNHSLVSIDELTLDDATYYAIDSEHFKTQRNSDSDIIVSDFSIYSIANLKVMNLTPQKPFLEIKNALYYFSGIKKAANKKAILVLDRKELNMICDYYSLDNIAIGGNV